jgi:hypothetical protein
MVGEYRPGVRSRSPGFFGARGGMLGGDRGRIGDPAASSHRLPCKIKQAPGPGSHLAAMELPAWALTRPACGPGFPQAGAAHYRQPYRS